MGMSARIYKRCVCDRHRPERHLGKPQAPPPTLLGQLFGIRRLFVFHLKREYIFFVVAYYNRLQKQLRGAPSVVRPDVAFHRT